MKARTFLYALLAAATMLCAFYIVPHSREQVETVVPYTMLIAIITIKLVQSPNFDAR